LQNALCRAHPTCGKASLDYKQCLQRFPELRTTEIDSIEPW
jgi:hypothetical protein